MRRLFGILIVVAVVVIGFGFYRGWFALSSPDSVDGSGQVNVNLATDTGQIREDAETVKDKAAELTGSETDRSAESGDRSAADVPPTAASPGDSSSTTGETNPVNQNDN